VTRKPKRQNPLHNIPVADIADALDAVGIPYVFTGSLAFAAHKRMPLGTKDVDVVVYAPSRVKLALLLNHLRDSGVAVDPVEALRSLDRDKMVAIEMPLEGRPGELFTFPVELVLPKVPAIDAAILARAVDVPYPGRRRGVKVVTLADYVLFKLMFFREKDKSAIEDVLRTTPDLDVGHIAISLGLVHPPDSDRAIWFASAVHRCGPPKSPDRARKSSELRRREPRKTRAPRGED
jgi:hypothetical protein